MKAELEAQAAFLARVRQALGRGPLPAEQAAAVLPRAVDPAARERLERARARTRGERLALAERMREAAAPVRLQVRCVDDAAAARAAVAAIAAAARPEWSPRKALCAWDHELLRPLDLPGLCKASGQEFIAPGPDPASLRSACAVACVGVTAADACVAETGTMLLLSGPDRPRAVSLLPSVHVAVCRLSDLVADFGELYALLHEREQAGGGLPGSFTLISGPSKTADIEAVMVHGAHGPREAHLIVVTDA